MDYILLKQINSNSRSYKKFSREDAIHISYDLCEDYKGILTPNEFVKHFIKEKFNYLEDKKISDWNAACVVLVKVLLLKYSDIEMSIN